MKFSGISSNIVDGGDAIRASTLLTGATGFLGTQIARRLVEETDHAVVALVRAKNRDDAVRRVSRIWWDWPGLIGSIGDRVDVIAGNISEPRLGLDDLEYSKLLHGVTHIIHTAADLRLDAPLSDLRKTNVGGTDNVLELARAADRDHSLTRLSHVSTAYVAGKRSGPIPEDSLTDQYGFCNSYEISKYEAELLVQKAKEELPVSVLRPGMVVGDSKTGAISRFNAIYFPLRMYLSRRPFLIPARPSLRFNMVPVDYVADAIVRLTLVPEAQGHTFHLTASPETLPTARELIHFLRAWARNRLDLRLVPPLFLPMPPVFARALYQFRHVLGRADRASLKSLIAVLPYFYERRWFLRENVDRLLGPYDFRWQVVMEKIMDFAVAKSFVYRPEETVHERILSRLRHKRLPVTYHDITNGMVITHKTERVRDEMLRAAKAMREIGVEKGDRVALVGPNSTRYLTIDVAIGILGAVSVPIYNTSPAAEISQILSTSRPKLLFVGNPLIIEHLDEVQTAIPVIYFGQAPRRMPVREVISWDEFQGKGSGAKASDKAPVSFSDMATIRFTSGTSGQMKAACFNHANLRWMAESVCTMMNSWRAMDARLSYLSYLPMNHVVEGILAGYSAYYSAAAFDIFFLDDIKGLPNALRKVRPHIFFSVPRFYEKVWQMLLGRRLAHIYTDSREGLKRRLLRHFLRWIILKKAGLDRCGQLVVGSAASGKNLLENFQDLGIEIYNAYGLTEAPLVTINRLGANRAGTVGEPLPETKLSIAEDGEIRIEGPQVAQGYLKRESCEPFGDGVLCTGDLGYMNEGGSLVLRGRKKEILVTSYGRNVDPLKIESMLRCVPGVNEALVVGEGRPFCAAILWISSDAAGDSLASVEREIIKTNSRLSHPEQIKRWVFLHGQPSIEKGEMTTSLKLRRREVTSRLADVIEAIYTNPPPVSAAFISVGGSGVGEKQLRR